MKKRFFAGIISLIIITAAIISIFSVSADAADLATIKANLKKAGFPDDYAEILAPVQQQHPNWVFEPLDTQKNFDDAVTAESKKGLCTISKYNSEKLLLSKNFGTYDSNGNFNYELIDGSHVTASPLAVSYFMDPRNFISDLRTLFQFENNGYTDKVSYDDQVAAVKSIIKGTFMDPSKTDKDYAEIISKAGKTHGANPCYLASKIIQEVGVNGSSSVSGTYPGYEGFYNFFNIGATADGGNGTNVANGLAYAKRMGWNSPEKSINGGAEIISRSYIAKGQSTAYLTKFNVNPATAEHYPVYGHQYMSAVYDPAQSAKSTYSGYVKTGTLDQLRTFLIPVYSNMPSFVTTSVKFNDAVSEIGFDATTNVRATASRAGKVAFKISPGEEVTIIDRVRSVDRATEDKILSYYQIQYPFWYKIKNSSEKIGYVSFTTVDTVANLYMKKGTQRTFGYSLSPNIQSAVRFMSLDPRIATIDSKTGKISAVAAGTTQIVAYTATGSVDYFNLRVGTAAVYPDNGWYKDDGVWYYNVNGSPATGWKKIENKWYYFKNTGAMAVGWIYIDGSWYYTNSNGEMQTGWLKIDGKTYYLRADGLMATGWEAINNYWYYFNSSGELQTGWIKADGTWYYLSSKGVMQIGWQYINEKWYYLESNGAMVIGWKEISGNKYYMNPDGDMATGRTKINGEWYYFGSDGLIITGWKEDDGKKYYMNSEGKMAVGWSEIDGRKYYMNSDGSMADGRTLIGESWFFFDKDGNILIGWQQDKSTWYYANSDGTLVTGWNYISGEWYYMNSYGAMQIGWNCIQGKWYYLNAYGKRVTGWSYINGGWYYMDSDGVMQTGWNNIDGKWYYMYSGGLMAKDWVHVGGNWYYMNRWGSMVKGWASIGGKWYYFNNSGAMVTGWAQIEGKWYYFDSNGVMVTGTRRINGKTYRFNSKGVWVA